MALEITATNVLIGIGIAVLANAIAGVLGWLKNNEEFNVKKFAATIVTAVVVGIGSGIFVVPSIQAATDQTTLILIYAGLFTGPIVIDRFRTDISGSVANRAVEQVVEETEPIPDTDPEFTPLK